MERCHALIDEFSTDIAMPFGINKCAVVHMKNGKVDYSKDVNNILISSTEDSYKYLGVIENNKMLHHGP